MLKEPNHYAVSLKMKIHEMWINNEAEDERYKKIQVKSDKVKDEKVEGVLRYPKGRTSGAAGQVVGMKVVKVWKRKGNAWWMNELDIRRQ